MRGEGAADLKLTRGALTDAPRRDTTMTQDSDSGDAVGDAGPTTDKDIMPRQGKNRLNRGSFSARQEVPSTYIGGERDTGARPCAVVLKLSRSLRHAVG